MKYIITENQWKLLIQNKKSDKTTNAILEKINKINANLNEEKSTMAIMDVLRLYKKKGLLDETVIEKLKEHKIKVNL
jgi:hypothetical protein